MNPSPMYSDSPFPLALQVSDRAWVDATAVDSVELDALGSGLVIRMADGKRIALPPAPRKDAHATLHWLLDGVADQARRTRWARSQGKAGL